MADLKPVEPMTIGEGETQITMPGHVRIERSGRTSRVFIDGQQFPWTTSPVVVKTITDANGVVDVTLAIRASSAEIVNMQPLKRAE